MAAEESRKQAQLAAIQVAKMEEDKARTLKANTVIGILPNLPAEADSMKIPVIAAVLNSLGYEDVSLRLATARKTPTPETVVVLNGLTRSDSSQVAAAAKQALTDIAQTGGSGDTAVALQAVAALTQTALAEANPGPEWAVVTGNYGSLESARAAADSTKRAGFSANVFERNNAIRTAVRFPTRSVARAALPLIRARVRRGAYGVNWRDWCPGWKEVGGHVVCGRSAPERPLD